MAKANETHPGKKETETAVLMIAWSESVKMIFDRLVNVRMPKNRHILGKRVYTWPEEDWERLHIDLGYVKD